MQELQMGVIVYIVISLIAIVVMAVIIIRKKNCKSTEGYSKCVCSQSEGGRMQNCQDDVVVNALYNSGKLTENTDFVRTKGWDYDSPGDISYPEMRGCMGNQPKGWVSWDFEDF